MPYRILGLSPEAFRRLYGLSKAQLAGHRARRVVSTAPVGYPDRIERA